MIIRKSKSFIKKTILILLSILPLIDSLNGFLVKEYNFSIGSIYKALLTGGFIVYLVISHECSFKALFNEYKKILIIVAYIFISVLLNHIVAPSSILLNFVIKMLFNIILYYTIYLIIKNGFLDSKVINDALYNQTLLIILCLFVPYFLGIGYYSYFGNMGYKGFFYSNNELNATLIILFFYNLYKLYFKFTYQQLIISVLIVLSLLLMSSKSSMIVCAIGIVFYLFELVRNKRIEINKKTLLILIATSVVGLAAIFPIISNVILRQATLFENFSGSILSTITSGRNLFIVDSWNSLQESKLFIFQLIFGNGFHTTKLIEMDVVDVFFYLGIIGLVIFIYINYLWVKRAYKNNRAPLRLLGIIMLLLFSTFTGHIYFTATAGTYFILYMLYTIFC